MKPRLPQSSPIIIEQASNINRFTFDSTIRFDISPTFVCRFKMLSQTLLVALAALSSLCDASMPGLMPRQTFSGVATFNNFGAQGK